MASQICNIALILIMIWDIRSESNISIALIKPYL